MGKKWWKEKPKKKTRKKKERYPRNESIYNLIQENEVFIFLNNLPAAVYAAVKNEDLWTGQGRPPKHLYDILICLSIKEYVGFSLRRSMGMIRILTKEAGIKIGIPCFKTLDNYLGRDDIKSYLDKIIELTSDPFESVDRKFATDATGTRTKRSSSWYNIRTGKTIQKKDHMMDHISTGVRSNTITAVDICVKKGRDNQIFREHVLKTAERFEINEWSGDSLYLARANCDRVEEIGGKPFFRPKKNTTNKARGSYAWMRMMNHYEKHPRKSKKSYNKRSNVETSIFAKKAKFGDSVRCKEDTAMENEGHLKWIAYNFSVLGRAYYEFGIQPNFMK